MDSEAPVLDAIAEIEDLIARAMDLEVYSARASLQPTMMTRAVPRQTVELSFFIPPNMQMVTDFSSYINAQLGNVMKVWGINHDYVYIKAIPHVVVKATLVYMGTYNDLRKDLQEFVEQKYKSNFDKNLEELLNEASSNTKV